MPVDHPYVPTPFPNRDLCDARVPANDRVTQCALRKSEHPVLVCANCGTQPNELEAKYTARLGGTHYRRFNREMPSTGKGLDVAQSCGKWIAREEATR